MTRCGDRACSAGYEWGDERLEVSINDFELVGSNGWLTVPGDIAAGVPTTAVEADVPGELGTNDVRMISAAWTN